MRLTKVISAAIGVVLFAAFFLIPVGSWLAAHDPGLAAHLLDAKEWIALYAVVSAVLGWLIAAWVQVRNSLKQHTVNTMLQSRLSTAFQDKASKFQLAYPSLPSLKLIAQDDWLSTEKQICEGLDAARYMLNYYEFIAVGIRSGDFDEELMRQSWRRIVINLFHQTRPFLEHLRGTQPNGESLSPKTYEHFIWLVKRWNESQDNIIRATH